MNVCDGVVTEHSTSTKLHLDLGDHGLIGKVVGTLSSTLSVLSGQGFDTRLQASHGYLLQNTRHYIVAERKKPCTLYLVKTPFWSVFLYILLSFFPGSEE